MDVRASAHVAAEEYAAEIDAVRRLSWLRPAARHVGVVAATAAVTMSTWRQRRRVRPADPGISRHRAGSMPAPDVPAANVPAGASFMAGLPDP